MLFGHTCLVGQGWPDAFPEALWREAFSQASVGLALLDRAGMPLVTNRHLLELLGPDGRTLVHDAVRHRLEFVDRQSVVVPLNDRVAARVDPFDLPCPDGTTERYHLLYLLVPTGTDPLTGLASRDQLTDELVRLLSRRDGRVVELVVLDLDGFKNVNDRHGHVVGDEVLIAVAARLRSLVRQEDLVCRWGGDEFVVLLDDPKDDGGAAVCSRIASLLTSPVPTRSGQLVISASCGSVRARPGETPDELFDRADRRMYRHKRARMPRPRGWSTWEGETTDPEGQTQALRSLAERLTRVGREDDRPPSP